MEIKYLNKLASLFYKRAIHPNLFVTGTLPPNFLNGVLDQIKNFKEFSENNKENKYPLFIENLIEEVSKIFKIIEPKANISDLKQSFVLGSQQSLDKGIFFFLHDCLHEILNPGSVGKFHQIEEYKQELRGTYSTKELEEEDIASALTSNEIINVGLGRLVSEEFVNAAREEVGEIFGENIPTIKENKQFVEYEFTVEEFKKILQNMKNTILEKTENSSSLVKRFVNKLFDQIEQKIKTMDKYDDVNYFSLVDPIVKSLLEKEILSHNRPFPKEGLITDQQAKKIRMFLNETSRIIKRLSDKYSN